MSVAKLLLSGFLVAGGLILGAFTLHRHFAPQGEAQTIALLEADIAPRAADAVRGEPPRPAAGVIAPDKWTARLVRAESEADAAAKAQKRQAAEKKAAEKRQAQKKAKEEEEPQTVLPWLWNLIANSGNNGTSSNGK
jgi:hypothetical protein